MKIEKIKELVSQMTLEEKASLCSGSDFWHTEAIDRLGIPNIMVADGPHGIRKQNLQADHLGVNESIKAVCFPAGCGTAASFNRDLLNEMGQILGNECQAEGLGVLLGPASNIKRSPVCGRNFEYYSEDPYLAGEISAAFIQGVQSKGVGTSMKHFFANNQETRRMTVSSNMDERTANEIYLVPFEKAVKQAQPWTLMGSYNRINGKHVLECQEYLTDLVREKWGFKGIFMSDWGAVNNRVAELRAGMDLEMPTSNGENDKLIVKAVTDGILDEAILDETVIRMLDIVYQYHENKDESAVWSLEEDHEKAAKIAEETMVLLKNDAILPLNPSQKVTFIGQYAKKPRYQGGGSSHINSKYITSALDAAAQYETVTFAQGFSDKDLDENDALCKEAVACAKESDVAVLFVGLPDVIECESYDRTSMRLPQYQDKLIEAVVAAQPNTVVVLHNGSPVEMPWICDVKGVIEAYLYGEAGGKALVDILYGKVNPSGKLAETFPCKLEDNPSYLFFGANYDDVNYAEGIYVGYRYYDKKKMEVLFPFGYGLSYTSFAYSNLKVDKIKFKDTDTVCVSVDVKNTGSVFGKEVVQLYVADVESTIERPVRELKEFAKVALRPGESKTVCFTLDKRSFAYYDVRIHDWHVESGEFVIQIGKSSRDIVLEEVVCVESTERIPVVYTLDSTVGDIQKDPVAYEIAKPYLCMDMLESDEENQSAQAEAITKEMLEKQLEYAPLRTMLSFGNGEITYADLVELVEKLNQIDESSAKE